MERKFCTVEELIKSGRMRKGDYVEYVPTAKRYVTKKEETGWEPEAIETDMNAKWILHGFNEEEKSFSIKTADGVNFVTLYGAIGFMRGPKTLDAICRECYSIPEKGIYARSMTIEDCNEEVGFVPPEEPERYAYYPCGSKVSGEIEFNGNMYKKVAHGYKTARFYMCDGGGKEVVDENGIVYRTPLRNNPVFVTETYSYYKGYECFSDPHWLASPCVGLISSGANFNVHIARSSSVDASYLCDSYGFEYCYSYGVRPLVSLSSMLQVDITDENRDGSSPEKAWKLVIDNEIHESKCIADNFNANNEDNMNLVTEMKTEEERYKIVTVQDVDLMSASNKLEAKVNKLIAEGFEAVGEFKMSVQSKAVILLQQMIKK